MSAHLSGPRPPQTGSRRSPSTVHGFSKMAAGRSQKKTPTPSVRPPCAQCMHATVCRTLDLTPGRAIPRQGQGKKRGPPRKTGQPAAARGATKGAAGSPDDKRAKADEEFTPTTNASDEHSTMTPSEEESPDPARKMLVFVRRRVEHRAPRSVRRRPQRTGRPRRRTRRTSQRAAPVRRRRLRGCAGVRGVCALGALTAHGEARRR